MIAATQSNHPLAHVGSKADDNIVGAACARLRQAQMRVTKPRVALLEALIRREEPISIEQLHHMLDKRSCDLVTVYRCLAAFEELGLVRRTFLHNGTSLYEFAHADRSRRYHILCKTCGKAEPVDYFSVEGMERLLTERGYTQLTHIIEFFGVCPTCSKAQPPSRSISPEIPNTQV
jgi:Fur family transcriptional regulator, ferric uptake regulator